MTIVPNLIQEQTLDAAALWRAFPPRVTHANKQRLLAAATTGYTPNDRLVVRRWHPAPFDPTLDWSECSVDYPESLMTYESSSERETHWNLNFANAYLFCAYGASAFAQDEVQVAEHPILGSLRECMLAGACTVSPITSESQGPTPITISGVERVCSIDTEPEAAFPYGIYGRRFARASAEAIEQAVVSIRPPTRSNILAVEAPVGQGVYTSSQLEQILVTAVAGFAAAKASSPAGTRVLIHSGHWGTGAYGGDRELMAMAQILAASVVGLDRLVIHAVDAEGCASVRAGLRAFRQLVPNQPFSGILDAILKMGFRWGSSDGN